MATDNLQIFGTAYTGVTGIKATDNNNTTKTYIRPQGTKNISANGNGIDVTEYASVNVTVPTGPDCPTFTITQDEETEAVTSVTCDKTYAECTTYVYHSNYNALIYFSNYETYSAANSYSIGSGRIVYYGSNNPVPWIKIIYASDGTITWEEDTIPTKSSSDLTANNLTVTAPAGYYYVDASKTLTDSNLTAANIKNGVSIFGVTGSYTGTSPNLQAKTNISPSTSSQTIEPDNGYDGLSSVQINAMPSLTLPTTTSASATSGYTSKATISRSTSDQYINIPTGYNSTSAYYKISAVANGSASGPTNLSATSATVTTGTNTITLTKTGVTTTPTVSAGYVSAASTTTATVTLTASVTTKAATTYHPSSSDQTISSGTYTTGTQTFKAVTVSGLSADKILSGTTIKIGDSTDDDCVTSVSGSVVIQHYYTGSSAPSSSTGENGDIYLKTS